MTSAYANKEKKNKIEYNQMCYVLHCIAFAIKNRIISQSEEKKKRENKLYYSKSKRDGYMVLT